MAPVLEMFLFSEVKSLVGAGWDADAVKVALGLIHGGDAIENGNGMLRTGQDTGASTTTFFQINYDLGHARTFLQGNSDSWKER